MFYKHLNIIELSNKIEIVIDMNTIIRSNILTAVRDWLFIGLIITCILDIMVSMFMGNTALTEQHQMSLTYMSGSIRVTIVLGMILFVCFHVRKSFETKEIDLILSRPISRINFIIAYWLSFVIISVLVILPILIIMATLTNAFTTETTIGGFLYWSASLIMETSLLIAYALVSSLILRSAVSAVLSCFAFYAISRLIGFFVAVIPEYKQGIPNQVLEIISAVLPRLDLFSKSEWLLYDVSGANNIWIIQGLIYIPIMLLMAITDFTRKEF